MFKKPSFGTSDTSTFCAFGQQQTQSGTGHVKYRPVVATEVIITSGIFKNINVKLHCITLIKEYEKKSLEELRLEDYTAGRKGAPAGGVVGGFARPRQEDKPLFGGASGVLFGATTTQAPAFGTNTSSFSFSGTTQNQPTGLFFAKPATPASGSAAPADGFGGFGSAGGLVPAKPQQPASASGTQAPGGGLFGATTTQAPAFGTNTSSLSFSGTTQNQPTGLFFAKPATPASGSAAPADGFGGFGSAGGLVPAKPQQPASASGTQAPGGGLFGATTTQVPAFGTNTSRLSFSGTTQNQPTGLFFAKPATPASGSAALDGGFGGFGSAGGLVPAKPQQPASASGTQAPGGGLFGATTTQAPAFGTNTSSLSFSGTTQNQPTGLFFAKPATPASGSAAPADGFGGFGSAGGLVPAKPQQPASASGTQAPGGGLFGATTTQAPAFGTNTSRLSFSGTTQNQPTGLFFAKPATPASGSAAPADGFGGFGSAGGLVPAKPQQPASASGTQAPGGGLFGATTTQAPAFGTNTSRLSFSGTTQNQPTGLFFAKPATPASGSAAPADGFGGFGSAGGLVPAKPQQPASASGTQAPATTAEDDLSPSNPAAVGAMPSARDKESLFVGLEESGASLEDKLSLKHSRNVVLSPNQRNDALVEEESRGNNSSVEERPVPSATERRGERASERSGDFDCATTAEDDLSPSNPAAVGAMPSARDKESLFVGLEESGASLEDKLSLKHSRNVVLSPNQRNDALVEEESRGNNSSVEERPVPSATERRGERASERSGDDSGGGLFGATTTQAPAFGTNTSRLSFSGTTQNQPTGLFFAKPATPASGSAALDGGFGGFGSAGGLVPAKPQQPASASGTQAPGGGLFGATTTQAPAFGTNTSSLSFSGTTQNQPTGLFFAKPATPASGSAAPADGFGGFGSAGGLVPAKPQQPASASGTQAPGGGLFGATTTQAPAFGTNTSRLSFSGTTQNQPTGLFFAKPATPASGSAALDGGFGGFGSAGGLVPAKPQQPASASGTQAPGGGLFGATTTQAPAFGTNTSSLSFSGTTQNQPTGLFFAKPATPASGSAAPADGFGGFGSAGGLVPAKPQQPASASGTQAPGGGLFGATTTQAPAFGTNTSRLSFSGTTQNQPTGLFFAKPATPASGSAALDGGFGGFGSAGGLVPAKPQQPASASGTQAPGGGLFGATTTQAPAFGTNTSSLSFSGTTQNQPTGLFFAKPATPASGSAAPADGFGGFGSAGGLVPAKPQQPASASGTQAPGGGLFGATTTQVPAFGTNTSRLSFSGTTQNQPTGLFFAKPATPASGSAAPADGFGGFGSAGGLVPAKPQQPASASGTQAPGGGLFGATTTQVPAFGTNTSRLSFSGTTQNQPTGLFFAKPATPASGSAAPADGFGGFGSAGGLVPAKPQQPASASGTQAPATTAEDVLNPSNPAAVGAMPSARDKESLFVGLEESGASLEDKLSLKLSRNVVLSPNQRNDSLVEEESRGNNSSVEERPVPSATERRGERASERSGDFDCATTAEDDLSPSNPAAVGAMPSARDKESLFVGLEESGASLEDKLSLKLSRNVVLSPNQRNDSLVEEESRGNNSSVEERPVPSATERRGERASERSGDFDCATTAEDDLSPSNPAAVGAMPSARDKESLFVGLEESGASLEDKLSLKHSRNVVLSPNQRNDALVEEESRGNNSSVEERPVPSATERRGERASERSGDDSGALLLRIGGQQQTQSGTGHVKYNPVVGTDSIVKSGTVQNIKIKYLCITFMKEYEKKSLEELRLEDYTAGRKGAPAGGMVGGFARPRQEDKPLFGGASSFGQQQTQSGTDHVKYNPVVGTDVIVKSFTTQSIKVKHHCITLMKEYEKKSLEELRLEDYTAGRKGAPAGGMVGGFARPRQEDKPLFGGANVTDIKEAGSQEEEEEESEEGSQEEEEEFEDEESANDDTQINASTDLFQDITLNSSAPRTTCTGGTPNNPPPLHFHTVHGENIRLSRYGSTATRVESYCKGIAFSARPIRVNEKVYIRFVKISNLWHGVFSFGVTSHAPATLSHPLPESALRLSIKPGYWTNELNETFCKKDNILHYYVNSAGEIHFGVNGKDKGLFLSGVDTRSPLWSLVDVYGNCTAVEFVGPRTRMQMRRPNQNQSPLDEDSLVGSMRSHVEESLPPLKYNNPLVPLRLHRTRGRNVQFVNHKGVAARTKAESCQGYVFTARPMPPGQTIVVQILSTEAAYASSLAFGFTSCDPATLRPCDLPDDAEMLLDRPEYWVVRRDAANGLRRGDEFVVTLTSDGEVIVSRNWLTSQTVMHVDHTVPLWAFVDIYGATQKVRMLSSQAMPAQTPPQPLCQQPRPADSHCSSQNSVNEQTQIPNEHAESLKIPERIPNGPSTSRQPPSIYSVIDEGTGNLTDTDCIICYENPIDSVLYSCGHVCMCYNCAIQQWWGKGDGQCPLCRAQIKDVIRTYKA